MHKIIITLTFLFASLLSGCASLHEPSAVLDKMKYVGHHISKVENDMGGSPYGVYDTKNGQSWIYIWQVDNRRIYNAPTGSSRYGNTITYHYRPELRGFIQWHIFKVDKKTMKVIDMEYKNKRDD